MGAPTRGKTAAGRLRPLDAWLCDQEAHLLRRRDGRYRDAVAVDLGYGRLPWTTLESRRLTRRVAPHLGWVGIEIDPERVEAARPFEEAGITFRRGGFELPGDDPVRLVRAMNVLRQYDPADVEPAWALLGQRVLPGGLVIEGTSDPFGRLISAALLRRGVDRLAVEGLLFYARARADFAPEALQPVLPKRWIHRVVPGEPIHAFFQRWGAAWRATSGHAAFGPRQHFEAAARALAEVDARVEPRGWLIRRGYLLWRSPGADP